MISTYTFQTQTWSEHSTAIHSKICQQVGWVDMSVKMEGLINTEVYFSHAESSRVEAIKSLTEIRVAGETIPLAWVDDVVEAEE